MRLKVLVFRLAFLLAFTIVEKISKLLEVISNHPFWDRFLGQEKKIEDVINESSDIVVGQFQTLGFSIRDDHGKVQYAQAEIEVQDRLKGMLPDHSRVTYTVCAKSREIAPVLGTKYIMIVSGFEVVKLLHVSSENMGMVRAWTTYSPKRNMC